MFSLKDGLDRGTTLIGPAAVCPPKPARLWPLTRAGRLPYWAFRPFSSRLVE